MTSGAGERVGDLVGHLARLAALLREGGVRVSIGDEVDALRALICIDLLDPAEVGRGLRCTLRIRPRDEEVFARAFEATWLANGPASAPSAPPAASGPSNPPGAPASGPALLRAVEVLGAESAPSAAASASEADADADGDGDGDPDGEPDAADLPGASPRARYRTRPFELCDERDLAAMEPLLDDLARRLATRRSRRWVPSRGRGAGRADLRRTLRRSLATAGEPLSLARRVRPIERARLVLLCDTSGSMEAHTRFLLAFARSLRQVASRTEVFAFNTELVRITAWLGRVSPAALEARLRRAVPDWSGGTRIGGCLAAFVSRHLDAHVDSRTVVLILSDGLDRGEPALVAASMRRIRARARRVVWLNPLAGDPRYQPTAAGMAAALPHIDLLAPAHDLASLELILPHLRT